MIVVLVLKNHITVILSMLLENYGPTKKQPGVVKIKDWAVPPNK
jgi:hypothetical protein